MRSRQHLRFWIYTSLLYLLLLSFQCNAEKTIVEESASKPELAVDPFDNSDNAPVVLPVDNAVAVDPVDNSVVDTSENERGKDAGKAYDGKGVKVLPILAKLCAKYESMNDEDKAKLLEKADTYRAKFQSVIDKIDDATALKYNLNRELINKILGLNQYGKLVVKEVEEATVEDVHPYSVPVPEPVYTVPLPEPTEPVYNVPLPEPVVLSHLPLPEVYAPDDNYDHLIIDHSQEPVYPDTFNIDHLQDRPVYTQREDQQYEKQFKDSMRYIKKSLSVDPNPDYSSMRADPRPHNPALSIDPRPIYPQNHQMINRVFGENYKNMIRRIPFPQQKVATFRVPKSEPYDMDTFYEDLEVFGANQARPYGYNLQDLRRVVAPLPLNIPYGPGAGQLPYMPVHPDYEAMMQEHLHQLYLQERQQNDMLRYYYH